jgi:hypothetical protein
MPSAATVTAAAIEVREKRMPTGCAAPAQARGNRGLNLGKAGAGASRLVAVKPRPRIEPS